MKVKLSDILEAFELNDRYSEYFLDLKTGEVVQIDNMLMTEDEKEKIYETLDSHGSLRLPSSYDVRDYELMDSFASHQTGAKREKLLNAITERGAFSRFKNQVQVLGLEKKWYDFQALAYRSMAINWCKEHDLEWEE